MASTSQTRERAIAGVMQGSIGLGQTVTWRGKHFGFWLTQKTRITEYNRPEWFQDTMEEGLFRSFVHDHAFQALAGERTLMLDELRFEAPLGPLGWMAERVALRAHLTRFLIDRNEVLRKAAEDETTWRRYLAE